MRGGTSAAFLLVLVSGCSNLADLDGFTLAQDSSTATDSTAGDTTIVD